MCVANMPGRGALPSTLDRLAAHLEGNRVGRFKCGDQLGPFAQMEYPEPIPIRDVKMPRLLVQFAVDGVQARLVFAYESSIAAAANAAIQSATLSSHVGSIPPPRSGLRAFCATP